MTLMVYLPKELPASKWLKEVGTRANNPSTHRRMSKVLVLLKNRKAYIMATKDIHTHYKWYVSFWQLEHEWGWVELEDAERFHFNLKYKMR